MRVPSGVKRAAVTCDLAGPHPAQLQAKGARGSEKTHLMGAIIALAHSPPMEMEASCSSRLPAPPNSTLLYGRQMAPVTPSPQAQ